MSLDLRPGIYHGALVDVVEAEGTGLVGDHAAGATVLTVAAGGFRTSGQCRVNGDTYAYVREDDALTITPALLAAADDGTPVESLTPAGDPETRKLAVVDLDMLGEGDETGTEDANLPRAEIPGELSGFYPLGAAAAGSFVDVEGTTYGYRVTGRPTDAPLLDGSFIDPTSTIPGGQAFSLDAPTATDGYPEDYGWWQVDATGNVLGFWRLVGGVWTAQTVVTVEALRAGNAIITALTGETITGTTIQTRATQDRGIKLGEVSGATNYDEALIVFDNSGVPFLKAVPNEALAVIAGETKTTTTTVTDGASLGGITEITRATDGTAGAVRLTSYTTAPKSAPTVTSGYDSVQFADDGLWGNRHGWATDGTFWYTARQAGIEYIAEKWNAGGALVDSYGGINGDVTGVAVDAAAGSLYVIDRYGSQWLIDKFSTSTMNYTGSSASWLDGDGATLAPTLGFDPVAGELLIAQSRPSDVTVPNRVRIKRYTMPSGTLTASATAAVNTAFAYAQDLAGVTYGTHDLGANRYVFTNDTGLQFQVVNTTGAAVSAEDFQSSMGVGKVGFAYTGGAFVSMDKHGLMRTYTGQDKATPIGDAALTKWVSNDLSTATLHTDQSPRATLTIKKRTKLNVTTSAINTGGTNAPDRVRIFVGQGASDPGRTAMWKQTDPGIGVTTTSYPSLATSGTNPVTPNGFIGAGGTVQRLELADGTVFVDGVGGGSAWTTYTPTFTAATTNPTLASFTITGRYARLGRNAITFSVVITATAASGYGSGTYSFGLPVAARAADEVVVTAAQTGPNHSYVGRSSGGSASVITLLLTSTDTAINPTTSGMASGTVLRITGTYEAA